MDHLDFFFFFHKYKNGKKNKKLIKNQKIWIIGLFPFLYLTSFFIIEKLLSNPSFSLPDLPDPKNDSYQEYRHKSLVYIFSLLFIGSIFFIPLSLHWCKKESKNPLFVCSVSPILKYTPFLSAFIVYVWIQRLKNPPTKLEKMILALLLMPFLLFCLFLLFLSITLLPR